MKGRKIYLNKKDMEILFDLMENDVHLSDGDERVEEKENLINKLLFDKDSNSIN